MKLECFWLHYSVPRLFQFFTGTLLGTVPFNNTGGWWNFALFIISYWPLQAKVGRDYEYGNICNAWFSYSFCDLHTYYVEVPSSRYDRTKGKGSGWVNVQRKVGEKLRDEARADETSRARISQRAWCWCWLSTWGGDEGLSGQCHHTHTTSQRRDDHHHEEKVTLKRTARVHPVRDKTLQRKRRETEDGEGEGEEGKEVDSQQNIYEY